VTTGPGLRERKKAATRAALSQAAMRLVLERGLEQVRVEDIAAEADVSPRTFNNYFACKEEALVGAGVDRAERVRAALVARPADEPLWEAIANAVAEQVSGDVGMDREWVTRARLIKQTPALAAEQRKLDAAAYRSLAEAVAERTGTDIERDLYPRLVAAVGIVAVRAAVDFWLDSDPGTPLGPLVTNALHQVAEGLPVPARRRPTRSTSR
jgi:AcrR family transcriptional regulator